MIVKEVRRRITRGVIGSRFKGKKKKLGFKSAGHLRFDSPFLSPMLGRTAASWRMRKGGVK